MFSFSIPPSGMMPRRPLPNGSVSSQQLAGSSKKKYKSLGLSDFNTQMHKNIVSAFRRKFNFFHLKIISIIAAIKISFITNFFLQK
jgi:hypothetical protein